MSAPAPSHPIDWRLAGVDTADIGVIDRFVDPAYADHNPPPFQQGNDREAVRGAFEYALKAFSDFQHEVVAQYADGDTVITRILARGRHTGDFMGVPATNKDVSMEGIAIHRVADGKVVEHWAQVDAINLLMQIGALPPLG
ncbi:MAG TPA: ester cyclase [Mycobacteriales bacterium]|nr:ester cyclase [Mycobacteriales bacterium]